MVWCCETQSGSFPHHKDPPGFLQAQSALLGDCFRLNLAGLRTTIVGGRHEIVQVANAPSSQLSAREAHADVGVAQISTR
eukprot:6473100-Amphidinium_carterae.1